ncbi:MAG: hypothetical protein ACFBSD_01150 [Paracoccaceae bacterium]
MSVFFTLPAPAPTSTLVDVEIGKNTLPDGEKGEPVFTPSGTLTGTFEYFASTNTFGAVNFVLMGSDNFDSIFDLVISSSVEGDPGNRDQSIFFLSSAQGTGEGSPSIRLDSGLH